MAAKALPSQEVLRQLLKYDPETGKLFWIERVAEWFDPSATRTSEHICSLWNARYAGTEAFTANSSCGYKHGHLLGTVVKSHRVIWKLVHGHDPEQIDHINGNRADNRMRNLREVSAADNTRNQKRRTDNTTGVVGVYWYPHERKHGKWLAKIASKHIGLFDCFGQAVAARKAAERKRGFHENHGRNLEVQNA